MECQIRNTCGLDNFSGLVGTPKSKVRSIIDQLSFEDVTSSHLNIGLSPENSMILNHSNPKVCACLLTNTFRTTVFLSETAYLMLLWTILNIPAVCLLFVNSCHPRLVQWVKCHLVWKSDGTRLYPQGFVIAYRTRSRDLVRKAVTKPCDSTGVLWWSLITQYPYDHWWWWYVYWCIVDTGRQRGTST